MPVHCDLHIVWLYLCIHVHAHLSVHVHYHCLWLHVHGFSIGKEAGYPWSVVLVFSETTMAIGLALGHF